MRTTDVTYGHRKPPGRIYEHKETGAIVALPAFPETDKVYEIFMPAPHVALA